MDTGNERYRTKPHGFHVVEYTNDVGNVEFQVRNWRGTVLTTRRFLEEAIARADELERIKQGRQQ